MTTGWLFTDCLLVVCPKCSAGINEKCKTPAGRLASIPHTERIKELIK